MRCVPVLLTYLMAGSHGLHQSLRLKMGYGNQLRDLDLVDTSFLPVVFELLDIGGGTKAFPLELWSVDQFYLECEVLVTLFKTRSLTSYQAMIRSFPSVLGSLLHIFCIALCFIYLRW